MKGLLVFEKCCACSGLLLGYWTLTCAEAIDIIAGEAGYRCESSRERALSV